MAATNRAGGPLGKSRITGRKAPKGLGVAGFVIAAAVFGVLASAAHAAMPGPDDPASKDPGEIGERMKAASLAWTMPSAQGGGEASDPHFLSLEARRMTAWAALATLAAGALALFGPNRILNFLAGFGRDLGRSVGEAGKSAARASGRAAGAAAKATAKATAGALKKPGGWLMTIAGLTIFALTGVAFLDIQWEAGLVAGAGISAATIWGWKKSGDLVGRALRPFSYTAWSPEPAQASTQAEPAGKTAP